MGKRLPKKFKAEWIAALRSGEYKQCIGTLHDDVGFCCLGVAAHLVGALDSGNDYNHENMPIAIRGGCCNKIASKLMHMNDGNGGFNRHSFNEIADYIEENL